MLEESTLNHPLKKHRHKCISFNLKLLLLRVGGEGKVIWETSSFLRCFSTQRWLYKILLARELWFPLGFPIAKLWPLIDACRVLSRSSLNAPAFCFLLLPPAKPAEGRVFLLLQLILHTVRIHSSPYLRSMVNQQCKGEDTEGIIY